MSDDHRPREPTGPEDVGSVGEEAAKLLGALSDWAGDQGVDLGEGLAGLAGHAATAARGVEDHFATGAAECTWCPVCRTVHAVRQTSPEVRAHLASAASSLLQAAVGALATAVPPDRRPPPDDGVERIDLDDDSGPADSGVHDSEWPEDEG